MLKIKIIMTAAFIVFTSVIAFAGGDAEAQLKDYFNKMAQKVKHTNNPVEKRAILNDSFDNLLKAFNAAGEMPLSVNDIESVNYFKKIIKEKKDELNGLSGYDKVSDVNLDHFAQFSMQKFEQSAQYITISVLTFVLIIILVILLV